MSDVKRVKYVVASRDSHCLLENYGFWDAVEKLHDNGIEASRYVNSEPKTSLAQVYNAVLNDADAHLFDWIVFIHSDAAMDVERFTTNLISLSGKYDAVGVAGAKRIKLSASPLSWFTASNFAPNGRLGIVTHVAPVGSRRPPMPSVYNPGSQLKDDYVAAVDGVCIAVGRKVVEDGECRFDERFPFDFYDLDFSMTVNTRGFALGVVVDDSFVHLSGGRGILRPSYMETEKVFREKWNVSKSH